ncbi:MAG: SDR family NAD(P)-dependent oxidoreductase [Phycisphaeraceae bacterium]|nr:SDR family NAD(P)-dependent oxidoreductase [Phycisphaeraceae bacterium]
MARIPLADKPIAITGASSGIGEATARACARNGMPVVLAARRRDRLEKIAADIVASGGRALAVECDVTSDSQCREVIDRCVGEFGTVYAVFANAGYGLDTPVAKSSDDEIRALFDTNFWGSLRVCRAAMPHMIETGRGHLMMCSSALSKIGVPNRAPYCASKAMQDHFCRAMRHELRPLGLFVSSVHPIGTRTEFSDRVILASGARTRRTRTQGRGTQSAEQVARAVIACLRRPRGEVWTSTPVRFLLGLAIAMPRFADWMLDRHARREASRDRQEPN